VRAEDPGAISKAPFSLVSKMLRQVRSDQNLRDFSNPIVDLTVGRPPEETSTCCLGIIGDLLVGKLVLVLGIFLPGRSDKDGPIKRKGILPYDAVGVASRFRTGQGSDIRAYMMK